MLAEGVTERNEAGHGPHGNNPFAVPSAAGSANGSQALRIRLRSLSVSSLFRFSTSASTTCMSP